TVPSIGYRIPLKMSTDQIARASKDNLLNSFWSLTMLTLHSQSPGDFLMYRMNGVLRAVIDANFAASSLEQVGALYAAIGEAQAQMVDTPHSIALLHFSRSFAVVLEEAVRERDQRVGSTTNNIVGGWGQGAVKDSWQIPVAGSVPVPSVYGRPPVSISGGAAPIPLMGFGAPAAAKPTVIDEATREAARAARIEREQKKDYSEAAIKGRVTVYKIPTALGEKEMRSHFTEIGGPIFECSYPHEKGGKHKGFALLQFADNERADAVVAQLNGSVLGGAEITVERAKYWFKRDPPPAFRTRSGSVADAVASAFRQTTSNLDNDANTFEVEKPNSDDSDDDSTENESDPGV
ncbi:hypothetical protein PENTCL1PPCAC_24125, partial [Pristionchus entomophagus]